MKESGAVFLIVPDGAIRSVYIELCKFDITGRQICHCSEVMTAAEAFPDIRRRGAYGYSIHPLFPFSSKLESYGKMAGAFFCVEGDPEHLGEWQSLLKRLGLWIPIKHGIMPRALAEESVELLADCGFTRDTVRYQRLRARPSGATLKR